MAGSANRLYNWWRYLLIFLGVSFNKLRAVHELSPEDLAYLDEAEARLREAAADPRVLDLAKAARGQVAPHVNAEVWKKLSPSDPFVLRFLKAPFRDAIQERFPALPAAFLSDESGAKIAYQQKPLLFHHGDQNAHRFPLTGRSYREVHHHVSFDPDSRVKFVEVGVPVWVDGEPVASLVAAFPYPFPAAERGRVARVGGQNAQAG